MFIHRFTERFIHNLFESMRKHQICKIIMVYLFMPLKLTFKMQKFIRKNAKNNETSVFIQLCILVSNE